MGIDINGAGGYRSFSFRGWGDAQLLALLHGWEPQGTYIEWEDPPQHLGYYYNSTSGQSVRADDAWNMAMALTRALDTLVLTPEDARDVDLDSLSWPKVMADPPPEEEWQRRALVTFAGADGGEQIVSLIELCAAGGFCIS
jgi:hypothetical protein